jgi:Ethanolamine utilization protein EutJ (predicted chaperonin)
MKEIKINIDEAKQLERIKKSLQRFEEKTKVKPVMRKTTKNIKWLINDLGLNELNAWLWMTGAAALTAAVMVFVLNL